MNVNHTEFNSLFVEWFKFSVEKDVSTKQYKWTRVDTSQKKMCPP